MICLEILSTKPASWHNEFNFLWMFWKFCTLWYFLISSLLISAWEGVTCTSKCTLRVRDTELGGNKAHSSSLPRRTAPWATSRTGRRRRAYIGLGMDLYWVRFEFEGALYSMLEAAQVIIYTNLMQNFFLYCFHCKDVL